MLTEDIAKQLGIFYPLSHPLKNPAFQNQQQLWKKQQLNLQSLSKQYTSKKYQFYKIGKVFGLETKRYLAIKGPYLVYYEEEQSEKIIGFCYLQNIYAYYTKDIQGRYILYLTNGKYSSQFYFSNQHFYQSFKPNLQKIIVQLNFKQKYEILEVLGQGSFSKVYLTKNISNSLYYAAKVVSKKDKNKICTRKCVEEEKKVLVRVNACENISSFYQFFQQADNYIFILQYLQGRDLMSLIRDKVQFTYHQILTILFQLLKSLSYCHANKIIHRDMKPQNVVVDLNKNTLKLIDFGLSLIVTAETSIQQYKRCGTMGYMAPQVVQNTSQRRKPYNFKCDVFSFGIIAHMLLLGFNPLKGNNYQETYQLNKNCKIQINKKIIVQKYHQNCYQMLKCVLNKNVKERPSVDEVLELSIFKQFAKNLELNKSESYLDKQNDEVSTEEYKFGKNQNFPNIINFDD